MENARVGDELLLSLSLLLLGKLRKGVEDRSSCHLVLPCFCHQEKALQQLYSELWCRVQSRWLRSSAVLAQVGVKKRSEESCVKIVTNFAAVLAINFSEIQNYTVCP